MVFRLRLHAIHFDIMLSCTFWKADPASCPSFVRDAGLVNTDYKLGWFCVKEDLIGDNERFGVSGEKPED